MKKFRKKKLQAILLIFSMMVSNFLWGGGKWEVYAEEAGEVTEESFTVDDVVYREIEPGKAQLMEWAKEIDWNGTVTIPENLPLSFVADLGS